MSREHSLQIVRAWPYQVVNAHKTLCIESMQVGPQPCPRSIDRDFIDPDGFVSYPRYGSSG
ncbi:MAG: hypothetical protein BGO93_11330 [Mesorhizobium sp. 65-26]|nr:MAG: hypothetical protein BGO93_11330 [Mesorhizobium sp. 65-26]